MWMQSLFFALMQCVFVTLPFYVSAHLKKQFFHLSAVLNCVSRVSGVQQVLVMSVYVAIRHRNDMDIFNHHNDGFLQRQNLVKKRRSRRKRNQYQLDDDTDFNDVSTQ